MFTELAPSIRSNRLKLLNSTDNFDKIYTSSPLILIHRVGALKAARQPHAAEELFARFGIRYYKLKWEAGLNM